jgi:hypothetical protein
MVQQCLYLCLVLKGSASWLAFPWMGGLKWWDILHLSCWQHVPFLVTTALCTVIWPENHMEHVDVSDAFNASHQCCPPSGSSPRFSEPARVKAYTLLFPVPIL